MRSAKGVNADRFASRTMAGGGGWGEMREATAVCGCGVCVGAANNRHRVERGAKVFFSLRLP